jgi:hypothetical protein
MEHRTVNDVIVTRLPVVDDADRCRGVECRGAVGCVLPALFLSTALAKVSLEAKSIGTMGVAPVSISIGVRPIRATLS